MGPTTKKFLVLLPVVLLGFIYLRDHADVYRHTSGRRLLLLGLSFLILYGWILAEVLIARQRTLFRVSVQASYYIYIFMVLTLTGYFILFREVSVHNWWHKMLARIDHRDHVNLVLFKIFRIYRISDMQILGNLVMLLPLGMYLPLRYRKMQHFLLVALVCCLASVLIETLQLVTSFRSADVDDVLLNTIGACAGFWILRGGQAIGRVLRTGPQPPALA